MRHGGDAATLSEILVLLKDFYQEISKRRGSKTLFEDDEKG